jgi:hypothetical protein
MTDITPGTKPGGQSLRDSLLAQAAAGLTLTAALIYGAGALTIALRLYFTHLPWESVLSQLPRDLLLTTGFAQVVLPAAIIGALGAILLSFLINQEHERRRESRPARQGQVTDLDRAADLPSDGTKGFATAIQRKVRGYLQAHTGPRHFAAWLGVSLLLGAAEAVIALPDYAYHRALYTNPAVVISSARFFVVVALVSATAVAIALILFPYPRPVRGARPATEAVGPHDARESKLLPWQWRSLAGALVALAVVPGAAAISASTLFPYTLVCSPTFKDGALSGNLIGTNGGWAYMVEYHQTDFSHDYFSVIPLSEVRLMTIGKYADCSRLAQTPKPTPSP